MARLEELTRGAQVKGILPGAVVTVVDAQWHGAIAIELTYKDASSHLGSELLYRDRSAGCSSTHLAMPSRATLCLKPYWRRFKQHASWSIPGSF